MSKRLPPTSSRVRAKLTEELILQKETDLDRWSSFDNLATQWDTRAAMAASLIEKNCKVLDIGAGAMTLGTLLHKSCTYIPADLVKRANNCEVIDLNKQQFPEGNYDYITFLGVLEYVHDIYWPLTKALEASSNLIVTYCSNIIVDTTARRGLGWVNDFSKNDFENILISVGWVLNSCKEVKRGPTNIQYIYSCLSSKNNY